MSLLQKGLRGKEAFEDRPSSLLEQAGLEKAAQVHAYQQKTEWSCSAATLKAAADHWGINITEKAAVDAIGASKGRGAETDEIVAGAKKLGFDSWETSFKSLDEAKETLKKGIPIIADVQSFNYPGKGHYVLIAGWRPGKGFILMDPNTKGKTALDNWRVLSDKKMEEVWWDRAMAPPHKLMPKWGVMIKPKEKEKTAYAGFLKAQRRAKMESATVPRGAGEYGKFANGDMLDYYQKNPKKYKEYLERQKTKTAKEQKKDDTIIDDVLKRGPASPKWGALGGGASGMALGSIAGGQTGMALQQLKESKKPAKGLGRLKPKFVRRLGQLRRVAEKGVRGGTIGAAVGLPVGASVGYKIMRGHDKVLKEKKANDPIKKKIKVHGINVHLEWLKGEERTYYNHDPLKKNSKGELDYKTKMKAHYGYVPKRWDADGEDLDVYVGPDLESEKVYIIKQIRPSDGSFDEHKIMLGYLSPDEAKKSYLAHMPKKFFGSIRPTNVESFKREFLMGKAQFKKKASPLRGAGLLGGGLAGYAADKATRKSQDEAGVPRTKKVSPGLGAAIGAWSGYDIGKHLEGMRHLKEVGKAHPQHASELKHLSKKFMRNPLIAGALLGGAGASYISHRNKQKAKEQGKKHEGGPTWAAGLKGALHVGSLGASLGQLGLGLHAAKAARNPGARAGSHSARTAPPTSMETPRWAKGAKTQKEVKKRFREQAMNAHPDRGGNPEVMKRVNQEWGNFQKNPKFQKMRKEAAFFGFSDELRRIMEGNGAR